MLSASLLAAVLVRASEQTGYRALSQRLGTMLPVTVDMVGVESLRGRRTAAAQCVLRLFGSLKIAIGGAISSGPLALEESSRGAPGYAQLVLPHFSNFHIQFHQQLVRRVRRLCVAFVFVTRRIANLTNDTESCNPCAASVIHRLWLRHSVKRVAWSTLVHRPHNSFLIWCDFVSVLEGLA